MGTEAAAARLLEVRGRSHWAAVVPHTRADVRLVGRLTSWSGTSGVLTDASGAIPVVQAAAVAGEASTGDLVAVDGVAQDGQVTGARVEVLARGQLVSGCDWQRFAAADGRRLRNLRLRAAVLAAVRRYFAAAGFVEVETPQFVTGTGQEAHLDFFRTAFRCGAAVVPGVLAPSPEHHMKRLLSAGMERIYQISHCFRNGEVSPAHNPEFTMLEWYRAYATYADVMADVENIVCQVMRDIRGAAVATLGTRAVDVAPPWPRVTVVDAFRHYAGVDLEACDGASALCRQGRAAGCDSIRADDTYADAFHKLLLERVEPALEAAGACFLVDYPLPLGALARAKPGRPHLAERAEAYVAGLELANGFSELTDAAEQRARFLAEGRKRAAAGLEAVPLDEPFLQMLEAGMPPAGGMALGIDRLVMLAVGASTLEEVLAFPYSDATSR